MSEKPHNDLARLMLKRFKVCFVFSRLKAYGHFADIIREGFFEIEHQLSCFLCRRSLRYYLGSQSNNHDGQSKQHRAII